MTDADLIAQLTRERDEARALAEIRGQEVARLADECGQAKGERDAWRRRAIDRGWR